MLCSLTSSTLVLGEWNLHLFLGYDRVGIKVLSLRAELKYGLVGLHTCGDLGPTILHTFNKVKVFCQRKFYYLSQDTGAGVVVSVGCCYMKLKEHYPMSR